VTRRIRTLLQKELLEVVRNRAAMVPVLLILAISLSFPFAIAIGIPALTGHRLGDDADLLRLSQVLTFGEDLGPDARVQLFLFQQFLMLFLLIPATGAMAIASYAVVGEKQARALEPLLATPITTVELIVAKILGALLPTLAISLSGLALYFVLLAAFAEAGVMAAMINTRTLALVGPLGIAASLVSLQLALLVSSRLNDPRTAQQFGILIFVPLTAILVAQFTGRAWLSVTAITLIGVGLFGIWLGLLALTVVVFDRETILTRWK
jgi:ABC-2 type transport system permease protein